MYVHEALAWKEMPGGRLIKEPRLKVFRTCTNLIRTLPSLPLDPLRPEDVDTDAEVHCLHGDTLVETIHGPCRIADLVGRRGWVHGVDGPVEFFDVRLMRADTEVLRVTLSDGSAVTCTPDHLLMTARRQWVKAGDLQLGDMMHCVTLGEWKIPSFSRQPAKSSKGCGTTSVASTTNDAERGYIAQSGVQHTGRSPKASTFTTTTTIEQTTGSQTSCCSLHSITSPTTVRSQVSVHDLREAETPRLLALGMRDSHGNSGRMHPGADGMPRPPSRPLYVSSVSDRTRLPSRHGRSSAAPIANRPLSVLAVESAGRADSFDLAVADSAHAFVVNGGLVVHNCYDALRYGLALEHQAPVGERRTRKVVFSAR